MFLYIFTLPSSNILLCSSMLNCSQIHDFQCRGSPPNVQTHTKHDTCVLLSPSGILIYS